MTRDEINEVIRKFWSVGYPGLTEREKRIIAYAYTVGGCQLCNR